MIFKRPKKKSKDHDEAEQDNLQHDPEQEEGEHQQETEVQDRPHDPMWEAAQSMRQHLNADVNAAKKTLPPPLQPDKEEEETYQRPEEVPEEVPEEELEEESVTSGEDYIAEKLEQKAKKKKKILIATGAVLVLALGAAIALMLPGKTPKQPVNLGTITLPDQQKQAQAPAPNQAQTPDVLLKPGEQPGMPEADFRNGLEKTSQWWKQQIEQMTKMEKTLKERFDLVTKQYPKDKKRIAEQFTKELNAAYPGSAYNGKEGYLKLSNEYDVFFDEDVDITKIVLKNPPYMRTYTFRSPAGAKQYDYQIALGKETVTVDLDPNIPNNCRFKEIGIPDMSQKISDYFTKNTRIPRPEGDPAIAVINKVYQKQIANTPGKKYDMDIFAEMILADGKVREYIINYAETGYTP